jgi:hypothetical protein
MVPDLEWNAARSSVSGGGVIVGLVLLATVFPTKIFRIMVYYSVNHNNILPDAAGWL